MYSTIHYLHSHLSYFALGLLIIAALNAIFKLLSGKEFFSLDLRISLFALILTHIQLVIGFILYYVSPLGMSSLGEMKNAAVRLTSLEHPLINIIAIALITIGWSTHKKQVTSYGKFKKIAIFYTLGLLLILSRIPWGNWLN